jgi:hypothetical protein
LGRSASVSTMVARRLWRRLWWQGVATAVEVWESLSSVWSQGVRRVVLLKAEEESILVEDMVA